MDKFEDVELPTGGVIETPDDEGVIRYRDYWGNCEALWCPGDKDYQE